MASGDPVHDYRQLNKYTVRNTYPLPLIKGTGQSIESRSNGFTKFDIR